jgi:prepilin peptidase CpaA
MALGLTLAATALLVWAAATDVADRRIPNRITGLLALVGFARIAGEAAAGGAFGAAACDVAVGAAVFGLGAVGFRCGLLGGGDVKLLAAGALWLGADALGPFLGWTALAGGALAAGFVAQAAIAGLRPRPQPRGAGGEEPLRPRAAGASGPPGSRHAGVRGQPSLPYGVAIAAGAILAGFGAG